MLRALANSESTQEVLTAAASVPPVITTGATPRKARKLGTGTTPRRTGSAGE